MEEIKRRKEHRAVLSRENSPHLSLQKMTASLIMDQLTVQVHREIYIWSL